MKLLEVKNLKTYFKTSKGMLKAVDDVSFDLEYGEALGLVGESGCGKTTSALSIAKLLPKEGQICGGQILIEGVDMVPKAEEDIRKHRWKDVSVIFQGAMNALNPVMTVGQQIAEAIVLHEGASKHDAMKRAGELLELVEIPAARTKHYPHEFSGGMKQRAMIAMALACDPKIIIGDEPTTALDVMVQAQILNLLEKLRRELNMGMILITHDLAILGETCDKIAVMYAGRIVETGSVKDIFEDARHPYTKRLIGCFPNVHGEKSIPDGIEGFPPNLLNPPTGCAFHPRCQFAGERCRREAPCVAELSGHTDTVPAYDMPEPFAGHIENGRLLGRGAEDVVKNGPVADAVIVGEPTELKIALGQKGLEWITVEVKGRKSHGGGAEKGVNAIEMASRFIQKIYTEYVPLLNSRAHPVLGAPTINMGKISGGDQPSTIPGSCTIQLDRRCVPGETIEQVYRELRELAAALERQDPNFKAEIADVFEGQNLLPHLPFCLDESDPLVAALQKGIGSSAGRTAALTVFPAWSDAGIFSNYGKSACVVCGPGSLPLAHSAGEYILLSDLKEAARAYGLAALEYCGVEA